MTFLHCVSNVSKKYFDRSMQNHTDFSPQCRPVNSSLAGWRIWFFSTVFQMCPKNTLIGACIITLAVLHCACSNDPPSNWCGPVNSSGWLEDMTFLHCACSNDPPISLQRTGKLIRLVGRKTNWCLLLWHESHKNQLIFESKHREKCFKIVEEDRSWSFGKEQHF